MAEPKKFPPIQQRMMDVLGDRKLHSREELWKCLRDDLAPYENVHAHVTAIRKLLPKGTVLTNLTIGGFRYFYQLVTLDDIL